MSSHGVRKTRSSGCGRTCGRESLSDGDIDDLSELAYCVETGFYIEDWEVHHVASTSQACRLAALCGFIHFSGSVLNGRDRRAVTGAIPIMYELVGELVMMSWKLEEGRDKPSASLPPTSTS